MTTTVLHPTPEQTVRERIGHAQALEMVDAVRCLDRRRVQRLFDLADLPAMVVMLAAMVDDQTPVADLLTWTADIRTPASLRRDPSTWLLPCGTHSAFNRHRLRGETACETCQEGERAYQHARYLTRKHKTTATA